MANPFVGIVRIKELRERILFTSAMLIVFRIGAHIPIPGINVRVLTNYFRNLSQDGGNAIVNYLDFFAGGAFTNFSVFMLGIMPYISMSIIMQLLLIVFPRLKKISQEEGGKKKIQKYQRFGTVGICLVQSFVVTQYTQSIAPHVGGLEALLSIDFLAFSLIAMLTVTTGTMFLMWIGEQITKRGIGNGISILIFAGIVARIPSAILELGEWVQAGDSSRLVYSMLILAIFVAVVTLVVYEQQGQRKIPVNYAKRVVGRKMYGGAPNAFIPFKINPSGVIPVIFASSILTLPMQLLSGIDVGWVNALESALRPDRIMYNVLYVLLIVFFAYFYTQVSLNPTEISKQIRENGGSIPGIRSDRMEEYLTKILNRIVLPGSLYLAAIAILPTIYMAIFSFPSSVSYVLGGTSLLIMVGVDLDTMSQIDGYLKEHNYGGLTKKGRLKGRNL